SRLARIGPPSRRCGSLRDRPSSLTRRSRSVQWQSAPWSKPGAGLMVSAISPARDVETIAWLMREVTEGKTPLIKT
ncbi:MAG: hypothetical protein OXR07_08680, partial [Nitrospira sp.]|nr:hypothetical protein [Nitrospira sp.]